MLVIQEKDLVILKVQKQRLRLALRRDRESQAKLDKYRVRGIPGFNLGHQNDTLKTGTGSTIRRFKAGLAIHTTCLKGYLY